MRLGVKPHIFLARLLLAFAVVYFLWIPIAPGYTGVLAGITRVALNTTEALSGSARTTMYVREAADGKPAIYYQHGRFPQLESGIAAEWVQANIVLLIPLMLAVPAATYGQRGKRLALAVVLAVLLQVLDVMVTVKAFYASYPPTGYGSLARRFYQFGDAFAQAFDTQLFPFVIWAGIHFRQLLGQQQPASPTPSAKPSSRPPRRTRKQ